MSSYNFQSGKRLYCQEGQNAYGHPQYVLEHEHYVTQSAYHIAHQS